MIVALVGEKGGGSKSTLLQNLVTIRALEKGSDDLITVDADVQATTNSWTQLRDECEIANASHARADKIAQALKADGIEATLLKQLIAPLAAKMNEVGKHTGAIRIGDDLSIEMEFDGKWRRWQQLSESGRERMAACVQHAIASLAGFPVLIIDRVDHLDSEGKRALLRALVDISPQYQAVLALATCQKSDPKPAKTVGVTTWFTEGGMGATKITGAS